jgi:uncharacterized protein (TIGR02466 family)
MTDAIEELSLRNHLIMAFATPVVAYPWPESDALNQELAELVLAGERQSGGIGRSNVGGWHSATDFLDWDAAPIRTLRLRIVRMTIAITRAITLTRTAPRTFNAGIDGWANVSRHGQYNAIHNHPNCLWSGTYYVCAGEPDPDTEFNGRLELIDPRAGTSALAPENTMLRGRYLITPTPGLMVLFPSWLNHFVHPFFGRGARISIAFNITTAEASPSAAASAAKLQPDHPKK